MRMSLHPGLPEIILVYAYYSSRVIIPSTRRMHYVVTLATMDVMANFIWGHST